MDEIVLGNKTIKYTKKYSKRTKSIRISINSAWELILTLPETWLLGKLFWVEQKWEDFLKSKSDWILKHIWKRLKMENKNPDLTTHSRNHYLKYKEEARTLCEEKCIYWSEKMWLKYNRIAIKTMKTKWGSCSSKKNLNFNYKILFLKEKDQDYLVVHELSHLKHMDHSDNFWNLVCDTLWSREYRKYKLKVD